ncbi:MAG: transcriptional repressor LexA [Verrucomicrobiota bacterium]
MNTLSKSLTARQAEVLEFARETRRLRGAMPSTREIQRHFGFKSQTAAVNHLKALERKGYLRRIPGDLMEVDVAKFSGVPVLGTIPAGMPVEAFADEAEGELGIDPRELGVGSGGRTFALKVRGDSMIGAHIQEGDVVVLEFKEPRDGDVVAALIDGETTLKRFLFKDGRPYLKAENPNYPDLVPLLELVVQGVVIALVRRSF